MEGEWSDNDRMARKADAELPKSQYTCFCDEILHMDNPSEEH